MAYDITDYDELEIYVTDGWREWYIPKFRIFMTVDGDFTNLYWTDTEKGASGLTRLLSLDYNDVTFGYINPSSAGEVVLQIESYIISAFGGVGGVQSVTGLNTDNTDPLNPVVEIAVDGVTITGDGTPGNPLVAATPSTPDLDAVLTAGNDGGANEITNIADGTAASSAATFGQVMFSLYCTHFAQNYVDATTYFFTNHMAGPATSLAVFRGWSIVLPYDCKLIAASFMNYAIGTTGTNQNMSLYVRVNNTTDYLVSTVGLAQKDRLFENNAMNSGSGISLVAGDYVTMKLVCPTWVTKPLNCVMSGYLYFTRL